MSRLTAVALALLVTFIWSTSWIMIKWTYAFGFTPLMYSGLRYGLGAVVMALFFWWRREPLTRDGAPLRAGDVLGAIGSGLMGVGLAQAAQNSSLAHLGVANAILLLHTTSTICVLLLSAFLLKEWPRPIQWLGIGLGVSGIALFHYPWDLAQMQLSVLWLPVLAGFAWGIYTVGGRLLMRAGRLTAAGTTLPGMIAGAAVLLAGGLAVDPAQSWDPRGLFLIGWAAVVNTALAFTVWASTQRILQAYESNILNTTVVIQTAILGWLLLGDALRLHQWIAVTMVLAAAVLVNVTPMLGRLRTPARRERAAAG